MKSLLTILMFTLVSFAYAAPPFTEPLDVDVVNTPGVEVVNTPGVVIENDATQPVPVVVQQKSRTLLRGRVDLPLKGQSALDPVAISWQMPDGSFFTEIPAGHTLFITDIIVSWNEDFTTAHPDEPFSLVFALLRLDNGVSRLMTLSGTGLPYSHSFATPLFFPLINDVGGAVGITRLSDGRVVINLTGYLEP